MYSRGLLFLRSFAVKMSGSRIAALISTDVLFENIGSKAVITLNRPNALNALNLGMIRMMYGRMKEYESQGHVDLVIMKGAGDKAFCAGGDAKAVVEAGWSGDSLASDFFREEYMLTYLIGTYKIPYIAIMNGITMGAGAGLSVHGLFRIATERTVFAMPETALGFFPSVGSSYFLPRLPGQLGFYLALTSTRLTGRDMVDLGLATHYVNSAQLPALEEALLRMPPNGTFANELKEVLDYFDRLCYEPHELSLASHIEKIDKLFAGDTVEDVWKNLKNDGSAWAAAQMNTIRKLSPTSMKVTHRQLVEGREMSFRNVFTIEYRLNQRCLEAKRDCYEGVRAVLIGKDNNPKWHPATLEEVTPDMLDWFFSPLPPDKEMILNHR